MDKKFNVQASGYSERLNIQSAVDKVKDHFALIHLAVQRHREIQAHRNYTLSRCAEKDTSYVLREIQAGTCSFKNDGGNDDVVKTTLKRWIEDEKRKNERRKSGIASEES